MYSPLDQDPRSIIVVRNPYEERNFPRNPNIYPVNPGNYLVPSQGYSPEMQMYPTQVPQTPVVQVPRFIVPYQTASIVEPVSPSLMIPQQGYGVVPAMFKPAAVKYKVGNIEVESSIADAVFGTCLNLKALDQFPQTLFGENSVPQQAGVYFIFDIYNGYIWYCGSTKNLAERLNQHYEGFLHPHPGTMYSTWTQACQLIGFGAQAFHFRVAYIVTEFAVAWESFYLANFNFPLNTVNNGTRSTPNEILVGFLSGAKGRLLHFEDKERLIETDKMLGLAYGKFRDWAHI